MSSEVQKALINARLDELGKQRVETQKELAGIEQSMGSLIAQLKKLNRDEANG